MAGCIEDLFTQYWWDLDRLKGLNGSPMEERFQDFVHGCLYVAITTYKCCKCNIRTQCRRYDWGYILRYSENDSGPEVGFGEATCPGLPRSPFVDNFLFANEPPGMR